MFFEYLKTSQYMDSIEIDTIGNCTLQAINDVANCWVLLISTELGSCKIIQAGPIDLDFDEVAPNVYISRETFEYNEKRLHKIINDFINNPKRNITTVELIEPDTGKILLKKITDSF